MTMKKKDEEGKEYDEEMDTNEDGEEEEEEEKSCAAKKSEDLSADDLEKSLAKLTEYHEQGDGPTRKQSLLEKAQSEELTKSEQDELHAILGGGESAPSDTLADKVEKSMEPGDDLQKALDVSSFLNDTHEESVRVNTMLAETIEKSDNRQHEFNLLLAKSTALIGSLVKSLDNRIAGIEEQPARAPKSKVAAPLQKSFANSVPSGEQMSKSEILSTMGQIIEKSCNAQQAGMVGNVNMVMETTKYEQTGQISPAALALVKQERNGSAVH